MAAWVPVVATAVGAVPEVVGTGPLPVEAGDADGLAASLSSVLAGGADIEALVGRGRQRSAGFTWESCAAGLARLYRDAHQGTSSGQGTDAVGGPLGMAP